MLLFCTFRTSASSLRMTPTTNSWSTSLHEKNFRDGSETKEDSGGGFLYKYNSGQGLLWLIDKRSPLTVFCLTASAVLLDSCAPCKLHFFLVNHVKTQAQKTRMAA